jgi:two-component system response regulator EvgA
MRKALIVDDHPIVRTSIAIVLRAERFTVIYEASNGNEVLSLIREHRPQLVVLDLRLSLLDGLEVLSRINAGNFGCRVLVFSSQEPTHYQSRCLSHGAMGYVCKNQPLEQLQKAVQAIMSGYSYFSALPESSPLHTTEKQLIDQLSDRELSIFEQLAHGKTNTAIAEDMHLSHKTVSTYKTRLMKKLGVTATVHLREFAKRNHLI